MKCNNCGSIFKTKQSLSIHHKKAQYCKIKRESQIYFVNLSLLGLECRMKLIEMKERYKEITGTNFW